MNCLNLCRAVCKRKYQKCLDETSATLTVDAQKEMYLEIGSVLQNVKDYADIYESRATETKQHLETFKSYLTEDQSNFLRMDELLNKTYRYSEQELRQLLEDKGVAEKKIKELDRKRDEANKKIRKKLEKARSEAKTKMIVNGKLILTKYIHTGCLITNPLKV